MRIIKIPVKKKEEKKTNESSIDNDTLYEYICQMAKMKYDQELRRQDSIIQQSSQMQAAFSFIVMALFMVAPVIVQYRGVLSLWFCLVSFSSITLTLLMCLLFATIAQRRRSQATLINAEEHTKYILDNKKAFMSKAQRFKYMATTYEKLEKSLHQNNEKRVNSVRISMLFFYISLGLCFFWFIVAICKLL